jgi:hypothetical protein
MRLSCGNLASTANSGSSLWMGCLDLPRSALRLVIALHAAALGPNSGLLSKMLACISPQRQDAVLNEFRFASSKYT